MNKIIVQVSLLLAMVFIKCISNGYSSTRTQLQLCLGGLNKFKANRTVGDFVYHNPQPWILGTYLTLYYFIVHNSIMIFVCNKTVHLEQNWNCLGWTKTMYKIHKLFLQRLKMYRHHRYLFINIWTSNFDKFSKKRAK